MQTQITLTITHARPIDDLVEKVAALACTLDGVDNAEAVVLTELPSGECFANGVSCAKCGCPDKVKSVVQPSQAHDSHVQAAYKMAKALTDHLAVVPFGRPIEARVFRPGEIFDMAKQKATWQATSTSGEGVTYAFKERHLWELAHAINFKGAV